MAGGWGGESIDSGSPGLGLQSIPLGPRLTRRGAVLPKTQCITNSVPRITLFSAFVVFFRIPPVLRIAAKSHYCRTFHVTYSIVPLDVLTNNTRTVFLITFSPDYV